MPQHLLAAVISEALLERLPCPLPPPGGLAHDGALDTSPWRAEERLTADPWRVGPCSVAEQRALLGDLRFLVTSFFLQVAVFGHQALGGGEAVSHEPFPALGAVLAAVAACMADACLRADPTALECLGGVPPPPAAPLAAASAEQVSPLTEIMSGTLSWGASPAGPPAVRPLGFSLLTMGGLVPFTSLLATHEVAHPSLLRARAAAVAYEAGVSCAVGDDAPVPFTWAGCSAGVAANDPTLDVVEALIRVTWRQHERPPPFAPTDAELGDDGDEPNSVANTRYE